MLTETVTRRLDALGDLSRHGKRVNGLFRLMESPLLWYEAYAKIHANAGATTRGVDATTLDGFSRERVDAIIARLTTGTYRFKPVRRVYIPKANGKKRPLGIPSGDDKLVQEVARHLLERIYEPVFRDTSHGFRPRRSCHTALDQIGRRWTAIKWLVDMDIQGFYDNIDHRVMVALLEKKIDDHRFIGLITGMLDAGYLEDWTFHRTHSGTPQGGICSPILANIYLHELDLFMDTMRDEFNAGKRRAENRDYRVRTYRVNALRTAWAGLKERGADGRDPDLRAIKRELRHAEDERRRFPSQDPMDGAYKRLLYCRYADDFVIGVIGSKADAEAIKARVTRFVEETLRLTVSAEKSSVQPAAQGTTFVGYWIGTYTGRRVVKTRRGSCHTTFKATSERIQLRIPTEKLAAFCAAKRYGTYATATAHPRIAHTNLSDAEIVLTYNAELRGLANYYALAQNAKRELNKLAYIWWGSLFKTLSAKNKVSVAQMAQRLKADDGYALVVRQDDRTRTIPLFRIKDLCAPNPARTDLDVTPRTVAWTFSRTEAIRRLNARVCEYCGSTEGPFAVHHVRKLKDVRDGKADWQRLMASRCRKTLVLCAGPHGCHTLLHTGTLPPRPEKKPR